MTANLLPKTIQILTDLLQFDVLGGQSNLPILDYIVSFLNDRNIPHRLVPNEDLTKSSLHCRIGPSVDGGVILSGHMDVVPVAGQDWHTEPFTLTEKDAVFYGRGTCDMKGFVACCLAFADTFRNAPLKRPVYFAFSYDEEVGCLAGPELARDIRNHYKEKPAYAIVGEPSLMQPVIGHKGICVLETTVYGSAGHSSRIRSEVSAIHVAAGLIKWLEQKMEKLILQGSVDNRFTPPHSSLHVGMISGGIAPNVIADKCTFQWDVRVIPSDNVHEIIEDFRKHCSQVASQLQQRYMDAKIITTEIHPPVPPLGTNQDAAVVSFIQKLTGNDTTATVAYAAEAGQFSNAGFETVICGPGDIAQAHRANEFVTAEQLQKCLQMLDNLTLDLST